MIVKNSKRPKIGLALGSGGPKGLAHIGVIKVFLANKIPIDYISGVSIGAMIGGFFAEKGDIKKVEKIALATNWKLILSLLDPSFGQGLFGGDKVKNFIEKNVDKTPFKKLKIPLAVVATNIKNGQSVVMREGELASAIRASISFPLVFRPARRRGKLLADGGLSCPVPVEIVREMGADIVVAVNLDAKCFFNGGKDSDFGFYKIANSSINLLRYHLAEQNIKTADVVIDPKLGRTNWSKFVDGKEIIAAGERAAKKALPQIKKLLAKKNEIIPSR